MDNPTPSGGTEPTTDPVEPTEPIESTELVEEATPPEAVEEATDTPPEGTEQKVDTDEGGAPQEAKPKEGEKLSTDELLKEATLTPEPTPISEGERPEDHKVKEEARFKAAQEEALTRIYASEAVREAETDADKKLAIDKEISKERPDFRNHLRALVKKLEDKDTLGVHPEERGEQISEEERFRRWSAQEKDRESFPKLFQEVCEKTGIDTNSTFSVKTRNELLATKDEILADMKTPNHTKALKLAAALLGLQDKKKVAAARKKALAAARTATPGNAAPTTTPGQTVYTTEQLSNLKQEDYDRVMELKEKGKVKIVG